MSWSTTIALTLAAAFLVYVAARGRLTNYMQVLGITSGTAPAAGTGGAAGTAASAASWLGPLQAGANQLQSALGGGGSLGGGADYGGGGSLPDVLGV